MPRALFFTALALLFGFAVTGRAQQLPVPQLKSVFPCGTRQGTSVEVEVGGANLDETTKLYFSNPGITAELISDPAKPPARFKVAVAANVPVGDYDVRSIGKLGIHTAAGGIDPTRVTTAGLGQENPIASNETESGRAQNRRTDIVVTGR